MVLKRFVQTGRCGQAHILTEAVKIDGNIQSLSVLLSAGKHAKKKVGISEPQNYKALIVEIASKT